MEIIIMVGPKKCGKTRLAYRLQVEMGVFGENVFCYHHNPKLKNILKDIPESCGKASILFDDMSPLSIKCFRDFIDDKTFQDKILGCILIPPYIPDYLCQMKGVQVWDEFRIKAELYRRGIKI